MNYNNYPKVLLAILSGSIIAGCGPAKYNLVDSNDKEGTTVRSEGKWDFMDADLTIVSPQGTITGKADSNAHSITNTRVLEVVGGKASVTEVTHEEDALKTKVTTNGQTRETDQKLPLQGTTVIRKLTDGMWKQRIKGAEPTEEQKRHLTDVSATSTSLFPDHAVAVGEVWTVLPENFKGILGPNLLTCEGTMTCTFVRVEEFEGHKYAVVLSALDGHGTFLDDKNYEETITMNVKGTFYRSMSALAGSRSELRGTMKTEIVVPQNGQKLTMVVTGPVTVTDTNTITQ